MRCGTPREGLELRCKSCGGPLKVEVDFPHREKLRDNFPYVKEWISLGEFNTPLIWKGNLGFKLDFMNPTGSYKDRGAVTMISYLRDVGILEISEDSSGNAGSAVAAYGAAAGMRVRVYVPESAAGAKVRQIEAYGASVQRIPGSRDDVSRAASNAPAYYASHVLEPHFRDGIRSLAYELHYQSPQLDYVFLPVSAGTLLLGVWEGFQHLLREGKLNYPPKIVAVQTRQVSPLCSRKEGVTYTPPLKVTSVADALVSTNPVLIDFMVKAADLCVVVDEDEIVEAREKLAKMGLYVEYSSATVYAAYQKGIYEGKSVLVLTGHGLKNG
ncbi:threonine synthase [Sulfodiicoccus acidiphilus]|uniref:Threonine synthase n=1 Tax=Sulfodiicoccus acidiphilus TaxID=1670455 RepID=A0A348B2H2_9CREN|nr:pyridoxal-phosphate dependent enzyme [Sulfodiicoccus acidiphilus]BBD72374.1 threonine synthase [Sulfodiicoccus acidiphilus]GGU05725.1 threonine synthase [Sulfodiicoccus acidiphilus]